jgi:hypothetical protein
MQEKFVYVCFGNLIRNKHVYVTELKLITTTNISKQFQNFEV